MLGSSSHLRLLIKSSTIYLFNIPVAQGAGTYMFRIDDQHVIDATKAGGIAHLINHSCEVCIKFCTFIVYFYAFAQCYLWSECGKD